MEMISQTTRLLSQRTELVALLSEAIDEFRNVAIADVADSLQERMRNILDQSKEEL
jgi:hypothetical protein